jgi:hypothetical protein
MVIVFQVFDVNFQLQKGKNSFLLLENCFSHLQCFLSVTIMEKCCILGSGPFSIPRKAIPRILALSLKRMEKSLRVLGRKLSPPPGPLPPPRTWGRVPSGSRHIETTAVTPQLLSEEVNCVFLSVLALKVSQNVVKREFKR